jgi:heme/copper-type cytochrome/quinol oxidase subunit 4
MKRIVHRYKISKYKRFTNGLLFAIITVVALALCLSDITNYTTTEVNILLPFIIAIISMFLGFITMFRDSGSMKEEL